MSTYFVESNYNPKVAEIHQRIRYRIREGNPNGKSKPYSEWLTQSACQSLWFEMGLGINNADQGGDWQDDE